MPAGFGGCATYGDGVSTSLGMPPLPPRTTAPAWRTAWDTALYGPDGFFRLNAPADHFRTAVHGSDLMARALLRLVRSHGLDTVVDVGAGRGELLTDLHRLAPDLELLAVEVAPRPQGLPDAIAWSPVLPESVDGLVVAHEWLDNIPCHVVEVDGSGAPRVVHVDPVTGVESLGHPLGGAGVPPSMAQWLDRWWPLSGREPGSRAEIGSARDRAWADVVGRLDRGLAIAVDYGHTRDSRPPLGSLRSYRHGRAVPVLPDGSRDVTAHVAVDSVAAAVGGTVTSQRQALHTLGLSQERPPVSTATSDPAAYVEALARAGAAADLTAAGGLGDFYWVVSGAAGVSADLG
jgi:SAM-dependent MidA family methyltransferase